MKVKKFNELMGKKIDDRTVARIAGIRVSEEYQKPKTITAPKVHSAVAKRQMVEQNSGKSFMEQFNNSEVYAKIYNSKYGGREYKLIVPVFDRSKTLLGIDILKRKPQIKKFSKDQLGSTKTIGIPSRIMSSEQKTLARHNEKYRRPKNEFVENNIPSNVVDLNRVVQKLSEDTQQMFRQRTMEFNKKVQSTLNHVEEVEVREVEKPNEESMKAKFQEKILNIKNKINYQSLDQVLDLNETKTKRVKENSATENSDDSMTIDLTKRPNL